MSAFVHRIWWVALLGLVACGGDDGPRAIPGTRVAFSVEESARFFDAPYPIVHRVRPDHTLVVADFPNPGGNWLMGVLLDALEQSPVGFPTTAGVWFRFTGPLDPATLPDPAGSLDPGSGVFLVNVDPDSPERDQRVPVEVVFKAEAETYSPDNLLVVTPRPGFALRPETLYAAVVTTVVRDGLGDALGSPLALERLKAGKAPAGPPGEQLRESFVALWDHLDRAGLDRASVRAATVYRTGDPFREVEQLRAWIRAQPAPATTDATWLREHDRYCVVEGTVEVPLFQDGERPFNTVGGEIRVDATGAPETVASETIRYALSIPKTTMPQAGFPLLFYSPGQGGAYTQFVDRGTFDEQATAPGRGPARYLADVGIAALSIEAPLTGPRHPDGATDGLEFWNVTNPLAFRDNVRQGALDYVTLVRMAETLEVAAAECPAADAGGGPFLFDPDRFYFYGHSTGSSIGAVFGGVEPRLRGLMVSGAGGSWMYNLVIKFEPMVFADLVRVMLNYETSDDPDTADPPVQLFQTLLESTEPINWARRWAREPPAGAGPRDVLILQGVIDGYFPPAASNALVLAAGAEPVSPTVETTLEEALQLTGGQVHDAPAQANLSTAQGDVSCFVLQYPQPPGISGHYVPFELDDPKYQYRCFFDRLTRDGMGTVVTAGASSLAPCP